MKLTLRNLLAYQNQTGLTSGQRSEVERKLEATPQALRLYRQLKSLSADPGISFFQPAADHADEPDACSVAAYLDDTLTPERVVELEKALLANPVALSELVNGHKILTRVIRQEDVRVPLGVRQRVYELEQDNGSAAAEDFDEPEADAEPTAAERDVAGQAGEDPRDLQASADAKPNDEQAKGPGSSERAKPAEKAATASPSIPTIAPSRLPAVGKAVIGKAGNDGNGARPARAKPATAEEQVKHIRDSKRSEAVHEVDKAPGSFDCDAPETVRSVEDSDQWSHPPADRPERPFLVKAVVGCCLLFSVLAIGLAIGYVIGGNKGESKNIAQGENSQSTQGAADQLEQQTQTEDLAKGIGDQVPAGGTEDLDPIDEVDQPGDVDQPDFGAADNAADSVDSGREETNGSEAGEDPDSVAGPGNDEIVTGENEAGDGADESESNPGSTDPPSQPGNVGDGVPQISVARLKGDQNLLLVSNSSEPIATEQVRRDPPANGAVEESTWEMPFPRAQLFGSVQCLAFPGINTELQLSGGTLRLFGAARFGLQPADEIDTEVAGDQLSPASLSLDVGVAQLDWGEQPMNLLLFDELSLFMTPETVDGKLWIRARRFSPPGQAADWESRFVQLQIYVTSGIYQFEIGDQSIQLRSGSALEWTGSRNFAVDQWPVPDEQGPMIRFDVAPMSGLLRVGKLLESPAWLKEVEAPEAMAEFGQQSLLEAIDLSNSDLPAQIKLLTSSLRPEVRWMAVRMQGWLGDCTPLVALLEDQYCRRFWSMGIAGFREDLANSRQLLDAVTGLENSGIEQADAIQRLLLGFSAEQIADDAGKFLVAQLKSDSLACRVLAINNLEELTGVTYLYRPEADQRLRAAKVKKWQTDLKRDKLGEMVGPWRMPMLKLEADDSAGEGPAGNSLKDESLKNDSFPGEGDSDGDSNQVP